MSHFYRTQEEVITVTAMKQVAWEATS